MIIALSQLNFTVGDSIANTKKIVTAIRNAHANGADLIVFPELSIGGFPAFDLNFFTSFKEKAIDSLHDIEKACMGISCLIGGVKPQEGIESKSYNVAYFIREGKIEKIITKKNLRIADWLDESRYYEAGEGPYTKLAIKDRVFLVTIGGDIHQITKEDIGEADGVINIHATPFSPASHADRLISIQRIAKEWQVPVLEVNQVGAQGDLIFAGGSIVTDEAGQILDELNLFEEDLRFYQVGEGMKVLQAKQTKATWSELELIHNALLLGIKDFLNKQGFSKAVIGLSGGLDSALVATLACKALGPENVLTVLMPSIYSTDHSVQDALDLVKNLGCKHEIIPIRDGVEVIEKMLAPVFSGLPADLTEENIQARVRAITLMGVSNKLGYIVLNTSNKSEASVGYGTLYGDLVGSLCVLGDVYKTQAYELARFINQDKEIIPNHILTKAPSAELRPGQKDSDSIPEYDLLDPILYHHVDKGKSAAEIIALGFGAELVNPILRLVQQAEFKRCQAPPILRVSDKAFGRARIMPLVSKIE